MATSRAAVATRALVKLLVTLAAVYSVVLESFSRESPDKDVQKVFRRVLLRAHLDKGGSTAHTRQLIEAKEAWDEARNAKAGRPAGSSQQHGTSGDGTSSTHPPTPSSPAQPPAHPPACLRSRPRMYEKYQQFWDWVLGFLLRIQQEPGVISTVNCVTYHTKRLGARVLATI